MALDKSDNLSQYEFPLRTTQLIKLTSNFLWQFKILSFSVLIFMQQDKNLQILSLIVLTVRCLHKDIHWQRWRVEHRPKQITQINFFSTQHRYWPKIQSSFHLQDPETQKWKDKKRKGKISTRILKLWLCLSGARRDSEQRFTAQLFKLLVKPTSRS